MAATQQGSDAPVDGQNCSEKWAQQADFFLSASMLASMPTQTFFKFFGFQAGLVEAPENVWQRPKPGHRTVRYVYDRSEAHGESKL
jgi:hypothetical protein